MIKKILVPLDGSDNAGVALDVAADIASKHGAHLKILHVGMRQPGGLTELYEAAERSFDQAEASGGWTSDHKNWSRPLQILDHMGRMVLDDGEARAKDRGVGSVETVIDWGAAGERILHHTKHPPVDMVVMGSRGASPMEGLFLGSVSHKVFHLAPCTCATVHATEGQSGLGSLERIMVAFDGSDHAMKAVELACTLAQKFDAGVKFVHVLQHGYSPKRLFGAVEEGKLDADTRQALDDARGADSLAMGSILVLPTIPEAVMKKVGEAILARATETAARYGIAKVETELLDGDPTNLILETAERDRTQAIIMGMRGLGEVAGILMGSVSYKVNHVAPCTCITVR